MTQNKTINNSERVKVWPELVMRETIAVLAGVIGLVILSILFNAPLEGVADPSFSMNPSKAPWYFLGLQELLVYFDPWVAGVAIPVLMVLVLMAIPYLESSDKCADQALVPAWSIKTLFSTGLFLWVALTVIGMFFRGPNWAWQLPGGLQVGHGVSYDAVSWLVPVIIGLYAFTLIFSYRKLRFQVKECGLKIWFNHLLTMMGMVILLKIVVMTILDFTLSS